MIVKNQEVISRMTVRLMSILDTDQDLSPDEMEHVASAYAHLRLIAFERIEDAYPSRVADDS